jgi:hypothetical protein
MSSWAHEAKLANLSVGDDETYPLSKDLRDIYMKPNLKDHFLIPSVASGQDYVLRVHAQMQMQKV